MIDAKKLTEEMADGASFVCAMCKKWWAGKEKLALGIQPGPFEGQTCTAQTECGSPMVGDTFSEYEGPLGGAFDKFCFVCGKQSVYGIRVRGSVRVMGCCETHRKWFDEKSAAQREPTKPVSRRSRFLNVVGE